MRAGVEVQTEYDIEIQAATVGEPHGRAYGGCSCVLLH